MSRIVTLRLDDAVYAMFSVMAERENRPLSNFIETAAKRFVEAHEFVDGYDMEEIRGNRALNRSLKRGLADAGKKRGRFVRVPHH